MPILGLREIEAALTKVSDGADAAARTAVAKTAAMVEKEAKAAFEGSHARGEPHVGGPHPNVVTGTARRSVRTDPVTRYGIGDYGTIVAPRARYYRRLELGWPTSDGTRGHQRTRPFPSFGPAAQKARREFPETAAAEWRKFLTAI